MQVTSITLIPGGPSVHITVADQNQQPTPPADDSWTGMPAGVTATADATGFNFAADASAVPAPDTAPYSVAAKYAGVGAPGGPVTGPGLAIVVSETVTALVYLSP